MNLFIPIKEKSHKFLQGSPRIYPWVVDGEGEFIKQWDDRPCWVEYRGFVDGINVLKYDSHVSWCAKENMVIFGYTHDRREHYLLSDG